MTPQKELDLEEMLIREKTLNHKYNFGILTFSFTGFAQTKMQNFRITVMEFKAKIFSILQQHCLLSATLCKINEKIK